MCLSQKNQIQVISDSDSAFEEVPVNLLEIEDIDKEKSCWESSACILFNKILKESWLWLRRTKEPKFEDEKMKYLPTET